VHNVFVLFIRSGTVNVQCYVRGGAVYNFKGKRHTWKQRSLRRKSKGVVITCSRFGRGRRIMAITDSWHNFRLTRLRPTALTSGKTPSKITWSKKVLQRHPLYHTLSYRNHYDHLYLAFYCSHAKGRCGADGRVREEVEEAAVRGKACQFFSYKNAITHKQKILQN
jgi:hypothetical protein